MNDSQIKTLQHIRQALCSALRVSFKGLSRHEKYTWVMKTLKRFRFRSLGKKDRGLLRAYLQRMTGLSRAQVTRLLTVWMTCGALKIQPSHRRKFPSTYTLTDKLLLVETDNAHQRLSGPATRRLFQRQFKPIIPLSRILYRGQFIETRSRIHCWTRWCSVGLILLGNASKGAHEFHPATHGRPDRVRRDLGRHLIGFPLHVATGAGKKLVSRLFWPPRKRSGSGQGPFEVRHAQPSRRVSWLCKNPNPETKDPFFPKDSSF
jgi:hypothetical protein